MSQAVLLLFGFSGVALLYSITLFSYASCLLLLLCNVPAFEGDAHWYVVQVSDTTMLIKAKLPVTKIIDMYSNQQTSIPQLTKINELLLII